jgi:hypothetical protein
LTDILGDSKTAMRQRAAFFMTALRKRAYYQPSNLFWNFPVHHDVVVEMAAVTAITAENFS